MLEYIEVLCHSSIKINKEKVIYIDPFKIDKNYNDADMIFVTHDHYDHYSEEDIDKIKNRIKNEIRLYLKHNLTDTIFVPMGIGNHPDHTVVFDSVLEIIDELKNYEIILYPEYPYARCKKSYIERLKYVSERLNITPRLKDISSKLDLIVDCISAFKSQFDDINRNQMLAIVREDCRALSTEYKTDNIVMVYFNIGGKKYEN